MMKFFQLLPLPLYLSLTHASRAKVRQDDKPPFFLLAGDSTTAVGGGWGDGFLNKTLAYPASGLNYGHSGATTVSFRAGGDWDEVLDQIAANKDTSSVYVTIQFGHNDQKAAADITITQFANNLGVFVDEVLDAGGEPILVSSLTRRVFSGGKVVESLANERNATLAVAESKKSKVIDLNIASEEYCNAIGENASYAYNLFNATRQGDTTHLNTRGETVFGRLVSDLLNEKYGDIIAEWTVPNATLSWLLRDGKPA